MAKVPTQGSTGRISQPSSRLLSARARKLWPFALIVVIAVAGGIGRMRSGPGAKESTRTQEGTVTDLPLSAPPLPANDLERLQAARDPLDRMPSKASVEERVQAARIAGHTGDLWRAQSLLESVLALDPANRQGRLLLASDLYMLTRFDAALRIYQKLHDENKSDVAPYLGLADVTIAQHKAAESAQWLKRASMESAQTTANMTAVAQKYLDRNMLREAEDLAVHTLQFAPDDTNAQLLRASLLMERNQLEESRAAVEQLLQKQPDIARAYRVLGVVYTKYPGQKRDLQRARELLAKSAQLDPTDVDTLRMAADVCRQLRLFREAANDYVQLLTVDPTNITARYGLGQVYSLLGEHDLSRTQLVLHDQLDKQWHRNSMLKDAVNSKPSDPKAHLQWAQFHESTGQFGNAMQEFQIAATLAPGNAQIRQGLTGLYTRLGWGAPPSPPH